MTAVTKRFGHGGDETIMPEKIVYNECENVWDKTDAKVFFNLKGTPNADMKFQCYDDEKTKRINPRGLTEKVVGSKSFTTKVEDNKFWYIDVLPDIDIYKEATTKDGNISTKDWIVIKGPNAPNKIVRSIALNGAFIHSNKFIDDIKTKRALMEIDDIQYTDLKATQTIENINKTATKFDLVITINEDISKLDFSKGQVYKIDAAYYAANVIYTEDRTNFTDVQSDIGNSYMTKVGDTFTIQTGITQLRNGNAGVNITLGSSETLTRDATSTVWLFAYYGDASTSTTIEGTLTDMSPYFYSKLSTFNGATINIKWVNQVANSPVVMTNLNANFTTAAIIQDTWTITGGTWNTAKLDGTGTVNGVTFSNDGISIDGTGVFNLIDCTFPDSPTANWAFVLAGATDQHILNNINGFATKFGHYYQYPATDNKFEFQCFYTPTITDGTDPLPGADVYIYNETDGVDIYKTSGYGGTDALTDANGQINDGGNNYLTRPYFRMNVSGPNEIIVKASVKKSGFTERTDVYVESAKADATQTIAISGGLLLPEITNAAVNPASGYNYNSFVISCDISNSPTAEYIEVNSKTFGLTNTTGTTYSVTLTGEEIGTCTAETITINAANANGGAIPNTDLSITVGASTTLAATDLYEVKKELINFLRSKDVISTSNRGVTRTTQSGTASGATITLSHTKVHNIKTVIVNTVTLKYGRDYSFNEDTGVVSFENSPSGLTYSITYDYGTTDSIYPDFPQANLKLSAFPRVALDIIGGNSADIDIGATTIVSDYDITFVGYSTSVEELEDLIKNIKAELLSAKKDFYYLTYIKPERLGPILNSPGKGNKILSRAIDFRSLLNYTQ